MVNYIKHLTDYGGLKALYRQQKDEKLKLVKTWERTGLLEQLDSEEEKMAMAQLLENQARQILKEVSSVGGPNAEEWSGVALPLVRRVFASISSKDFVSIQPMNAPSGLVFYLDFTYGTKQPGFEVTPGPYLQENSVYGVTSAPGQPTGGLYGAGRFGYSMNDYTATVRVVGVEDATWEDVDFNPALEEDIQNGVLKRVTYDYTGLLHDPKAVRAFSIEDGGTKIDNYYPAYTKPIDENKQPSDIKVTYIIRPISGQTIAVDDTATTHYFKQPTDYNRGDFEAPRDPAWGEGDYGPDKYNPTNVGANAIDIPEVNIDMRSIPIVAKSRKLKAVWTPEFAQDLQAYHAIDAEAQLTAILSEYISMEVDLEILEMLFLSAPTRDVWSARVGEVYVGNDTFDTQDNQQGRALAYQQPSWNQTLGIKISKLSNLIHQKTLRGHANFIVVSPIVSTVLENLDGFVSDSDANRVTYAMGVEKIGSFQRRFNVYVNPYIPEGEVLVGYKGSTFLETGAVYAPYIPLIMTPLLYDTVNLTPRKGVMTRYAKVITRPEFYARLTIAGLNYV